MPEAHTIRCEVHYSGQVQGVGFRWNACNIARGFAVTGFVRNLPDGRVHLVAEGKREEVERFLAAIADSMQGNIRHAETVVSPATGEYQSFRNHEVSRLMPDEAYDPRYLEGIEHFNVCDFFEAHEVWEELWADYRGPLRKFYQGRIQVAVCLHHFGNGNTRGAKKLYLSSIGDSEEYRPRHQGLDLEKLLREFAACLQRVMDSTEEFPKIDIVPDLIPEIHLIQE